jgi:hypothetical protein
MREKKKPEREPRWLRERRARIAALYARAASIRAELDAKRAGPAR